MKPAAVDLVAARRRIREHVRRTPLHESAWLSRAAGSRVWLKLENVQLTGSFKIRGAMNALMKIAERVPGAAVPAPAEAGPCVKQEIHVQPEIHAQEIVTASAGNHGLAIAYTAERLGLRATVFTPANAPRTKVDAIERHGARLKEAPNYDDAEIAAKQFAADTGATFVSPYNHEDVIAGAGTIGLEVLEDAPETDTVLVPIGGGGLISGVAIAVKAIAPSVRVIGVEAEASSAFATSLRNGRITVIDPKPTIADGLGGNMDPDTITFPIVQRHVDDVVTVSEPELFEAVRALVAEEHQIAEGAGAAATAALLAGKVRGRAIVAVVSGANIDANRLTDILSE